MNIILTPEAFRPYRSRRSNHDHNYCVAEAFYDSVISGEVDPVTNRTYLPIFWANSYHEQAYRTNNRVFHIVPEIQKFIDTKLDSQRIYFTVMRCDDGPYETLPSNVLVFGACGRCNIEIPLASEIPYQGENTDRPILASFVGTKRCGGPTDQDVVLNHSEYNPEGIGSQIRQAMFTSFTNSEIFCLRDQGGGNGKRWDEYANILQQSVFGLAPRGYGRTSFRLYESMAFGAIPVYISDRFHLPYNNELNWNEFCVLCPPKEIVTLPRRLEQTSDSWIKNARGIIREIYPTHFELRGVCNQIAKQLRVTYP